MVARPSCGRTTIAGHQIRRLVGVVHGWACRVPDGTQLISGSDRWTGWNEAGRGEHFRLTICLIRLPVRSSVRYPHLAIHACARLSRPLPHDLEAHHERRPLLVENLLDEAHE